MVPNLVVDAANVCQMSTVLISLAAYLPQWVKLYRTKSSENISLRSWCLWVVSSAFAFFYAVVQLLLNDRGWPLVVSTLTSFAFIVLTVLMIVKYRPKRAAKAATA
jgi:uncharacterized protein with PQ loop repeat